MWLITNSEGYRKYLIPGKTINFGRKQADVILNNDSSISRSHAIMTVTTNDHSKGATTCVIKDSKSKYGTYVIRNEQQIKVSSDGLELQPLDKIKIGLQHHIFNLDYIHLITAVSQINMSDKKKLIKIMDDIGGKIVNNFDSICTHLTVTTLASTTKVILALIAGVPIVNVNYWTALMETVESDNVLPDFNLFTPSLQDKGVDSKRVSLKPNLARQSLFSGLTFVFFCEESFINHQKIIKEAGGKAELHSANFTEHTEKYFMDNWIVMQINNDIASTEFKAYKNILAEKMQKKNLRTIAEAEIPLAIMYLSTEQYCNPKYSFKKLFKRHEYQKDNSEVLVLDTQDILQCQPSNSNQDLNNPFLQGHYFPETEDINESIDKVNVKLNEENVQHSNELLDNIIIENKKVNDLETLNTNIFEKTVKQTEFKNNDNKICEEQEEQNIFGKKIAVKDINMQEKNIYVNDKKESISNCNSTRRNLVTNRSFNQKQNISNLCKRKQDILEPEETFKNFKTHWTNTTESMASSEKKKKTSTTNDDFKDFDHKIKKTQTIKAEKYGFKKCNKKNIDFDLDYLDAANFCNKSNDLCQKEDWSSSKVLKPENLTKNHLEQKITDGFILDTSKTKSVSNNSEKKFQKVCIKVPQSRITLSDMSVWRS